MGKQRTLTKYRELSELATRLYSDLDNLDFILLYAYNGTGKTRLSMEFKNIWKRKRKEQQNTLYFNAFTEDLFYWDNDLENDSERVLKFNSESKLFNGFKELALENKIFEYLQRYADFEFKIDYDNWNIIFSKHIKNNNPNSGSTGYIRQDNIKISRGEENLFIWCIFLAICNLTIEDAEAYNWVEYFYIDDPISSLDDNNAIAVACDLAKLLKKSDRKIKTVISSHHGLFFNVMFNELKKEGTNYYFLHKDNNEEYTLQKTDDIPFFHHVALLSELKKAMETRKIYTYHFNMLRSIMEKTSRFFGLDDFSKCIAGIQDEVLFARALNLLSHGAYSIFEPIEMNEDNKNLFTDILTAFIDKYKFNLPSIN